MRHLTIKPQDVIPTIGALYPDKLARSLFLYEFDGNPPPICLKELDNGLYIIDGHHRTAVRQIYDDTVPALILEDIDECEIAVSDAGELDFMLHQYAYVSPNNLHKLDDRPIDNIITPFLLPKVIDAIPKYINIMDDHELLCAHRASTKLREWFE